MLVAARRIRVIAIAVLAMIGNAIIISIITATATASTTASANCGYRTVIIIVR